ncbi:MAG: PAS domain S-box protein, partial [Dokdonella sp.]|uniref:PAS domain S-box protein n=1 Tax=Dokdonella sp. TaxID=2291710 RepID=UPI003BAF9DCF
MVEKVEFSGAKTDPTEARTADEDVWEQLAEFASRADADPVLRLLVGEAITAHRNLRGVTATIANRYRAMFDTVPDAITIHDETGLILDANASTCRLLDLDRERLLGRSIEDAFPGLDSTFISRLRLAFDADETVIATSTIRRGAGAEATLELNARGYLDANQKRIIAVSRDLGPRALAELQLRNSEAGLRRIL